MHDGIEDNQDAMVPRSEVVELEDSAEMWASIDGKIDSLNRTCLET